MSVHPYFVDRARQSMRRAGGNPDVADELAGWAERAHAAGQEGADRGVIVSERGELIAETFLDHKSGSAIRYVLKGVVKGAPARVCVADGPVLDLAMAEVRRELGVALIHVTRSEVCTGASWWPAPTVASTPPTA